MIEWEDVVIEVEKVVELEENTQASPSYEDALEMLAPTGRGHFTLESIGDSETLFSWEETLRFPWWMGGPVGALFARPVLKAIWKRNLKRLKNILEE